MAASVRLAGLGLATSLGWGCAENEAGIRRGGGQFARLEVDQLKPPIELPYLAVRTSLVGARERFEQLIDYVLDEVLTACPLSASLRRQTPVFIGSSSYGVALAEERYWRDLRLDCDEALPMPIDGFGHISQRARQQFGLMGPDFSFNTACTAGANALLSAARYIKAGHGPYALVIGLETLNVTSLAGFHGMQLLSDQVMRPFDKRRNGLVLGEGSAAVLLAADEQSQPGIHLWGGASRCDRYSISASNPDGSAIAMVMQAALADAGLCAGDICAIKAHGTASPLNDDGEAAGMRRVFSTMPPFFALKPYIGHTLGGCGVLETALVVQALQQGYIPATPGFEQADEALAVVPIIEPQRAHAGFYMLNFFGFGGNNNSLILRFC